jgi:hypothetical protein
MGVWLCVGDKKYERNFGNKRTGRTVLRWNIVMVVFQRGVLRIMSKFEHFNQRYWKYVFISKELIGYLVNILWIITINPKLNEDSIFTSNIK